MTPGFADLVARARALAGRGGRRVLGIAGAPASGKSTLAARLVSALDGQAVLVGMDGFHLAQCELARLGRTERKGAPDTFDAVGYVDLLDRLRRNGSGDDHADVVYAPLFRREIEEPIAGAVPVHPETPLVVTEGNYLLLDEGPWARVRPLLDEAWFLAPDEGERIARLIARHRRFGRSPEQAEQRALGSDQANADRIAPTARHADLVLVHAYDQTPQD
ncbi:nucleoside/nucleotide kinase family protein [Goodfellowiella coeruleoviolacea]|uniref:Panthothenate kinase n=1 Tax=Goodfellowiella coeruleoviolacea TaxID=334858 RepID=A0AAE3GJ75_9PSEU|nr:nucleoside/nucleotide kinase family protein [Goodfellowiella coeruleoviolacea]MCP2168558.1 Panthothenate kinase [Goodfellowiella coeruleoviolacea]